MDLHRAVFGQRGECALNLRFRCQRGSGVDAQVGNRPSRDRMHRTIFGHLQGQLGTDHRHSTMGLAEPDVPIAIDITDLFVKRKVGLWGQPQRTRQDVHRELAGFLVTPHRRRHSSGQEHRLLALRIERSRVKTKRAQSRTLDGCGSGKQLLFRGNRIKLSRSTTGHHQSRRAASQRNVRQKTKGASTGHWESSICKQLWPGSLRRGSGKTLIRGWDFFPTKTVSRAALRTR